jgi:hypothetical protein
VSWRVPPIAAVALVAVACAQPRSRPVAAPPTPPVAESAEEPAAEEPAAEEPAAEEQPAAEQPAAEDPLAAEMAAYRAAKPVFDEYCGHCHTTPASEKLSKSRRKALKHFSMDGYPFGGHHAGDLGAEIRHVLGADGSKPTMPKDDKGGLEPDELAAIVRWTEAFDAAAAAGVGHHAERGHAKGHDEHDGGEGHHHGHHEGGKGH